MREGDTVLAAVAGSTRSSVAFFSNQGVCYVARIHDIPAATGYGDPIQKLFKLGDGERIVGALSFDPRMIEVPPVDPDAPEPLAPYALAVTKRGLGFRFSLRAHAEPSTRAGRKFARPGGEDEVMAVVPLGIYQEADWIMCASSDGHGLAVDAEEIPIVSGPAKGVMVMKLGSSSSGWKAQLLGAELGHRDLDSITVETEKGKGRNLTLQSLRGTRAGKGHAIVRRGGFSRFVPRPVETPSLGGED
jgi:DNA gyrase subunit A